MDETARSLVSLNGEWDLAFDPHNVGKEEGWQNRFPKSVSMDVPGVWEQIRPGYDGVGWYRREFEAPEEWQGKTVRLRFMASMYYSECWLNGNHLGDHEGGYTPFEFDISGKVQTGSNEVVVRVLNPPIGEELEGFRAGAPLNQGDLPIGKAGWYFNFGGLWQDVDLIVTNKVFVEDVFVHPHPWKKKAVLNVTVRNGRSKRECELHCAVTPADGDGEVVEKTVTAKLKKGANEIAVTMELDDVHLWSPDDPFLYRATVETVSDDEVLDAKSERFGMREFTIKRGRYHLNGKPIQLKGFLHQGMYPRTLSFPETREAAVEELKLLKDNGYNFLRLHLKPAPWWYLDLTDEMGILVEGEPPAGWNCKSPDFERRLRTEVEGFFLRDRNHASVVFWCLLNEPHHFRGYTMDELRGITQRIGKMARRLDPTRMLSDLAGGPSTAPGEKGMTRVLLPYVNRTAKSMDLHAYCGVPLHESSIARYRTMGKAGVAQYICEYGAPLVAPDFEEVLSRYTPEERKLGLEDYALHRDFYESLKEQFAKADLEPTFGDVKKMLAAANRVRADEMRLVTAGMRANTKLSGFAFCQLSDASGELFGATDVWRKPKETFRAITSVMGTPLLMPEITPRVSFPGDALDLLVNLVNEDVLGPTYNYKIELGKPRGKAVETLTGKVKATGEAQTVLKTTLKPDLKPGKYRLRATLTKGGKTVSDQSVSLTVLAEPRFKVDLVAGWDKRGTVEAFLDQAGVEMEVFSNSYRNKNVPIVVDMRDGGCGRNLRGEVFGQLKKFVQLGGCALFLQGEALQFYELLFPTIIRSQPIMRTIGYVKKHPIFRGLPSDCVVGYEYADVFVDLDDKGKDVLAAGGEVIAGGLSQNMWTRPARYFWGANLYTVPVGRGQVVVCNMKVLDRLEDRRIAQVILANMINYAADVIQPGGEEKLLTRCIDPLKEGDY